LAFDGEKMFGLLRSKDLAEKEARVTEIGKMLFQQISVVRDKANAGRIDKSLFEGIFPSSGVKVVQSKLAARRVGETISTDNDKYTEVFMGCQEFDTGISAARYEVSEYSASGEYTPNKLERYLSTGKIE
jgi:hypothetical protein